MIALQPAFRSGISFFEQLDRDVALDLVEVQAYKNGVAELCYEVRNRADLSLDRPPLMTLFDDSGLFAYGRALCR